MPVKPHRLYFQKTKNISIMFDYSVSKTDENLRGKKLLILGATIRETALVKRAQSFGIYVITTDYHTDYTVSPAKKIADEAWDVSWADIDTLEQLCIEHHIDGVTAGWSEFRVENMIKLTTRLHLPCYLTMEQLDITRDKIKFKQECRKYGVPVVNEYASPDDVVKYPVILKPTDRAGSIGISIATNSDELKTAYNYAMEMSVSKQVIIEDYIKADKVDFYYAIEDGKCTLISSCDTINAINNGTNKVVQSAWLYPERHLDAAIEKVDSAIRNMIQGMGIKYGCIFFSGFIDGNKNFTFFESGFRLEGANQYRYTEKCGLMNYLDLFIYHALYGDTKLIPRGSLYNPDMKCVTINLYAKKGIISKIGGMDEIEKIDNCTLALTYGVIGEKCDDDKAILSKIGMFAFSSEDPKLLRDSVEKAYSLFCVYDESGNDMIYDRIDTSVIETWWN